MVVVCALVRKRLEALQYARPGVVIELRHVFTSVLIKNLASTSGPEPKMPKKFLEYALMFLLMGPASSWTTRGTHHRRSAGVRPFKKGLRAQSSGPSGVASNFSQKSWTPPRAAPRRCRKSRGLLACSQLKCSWGKSTYSVELFGTGVRSGMSS